MSKKPPIKKATLPATAAKPAAKNTAAKPSPAAPNKKTSSVASKPNVKVINQKIDIKNEVKTEKQEERVEIKSIVMDEAAKKRHDSAIKIQTCWRKHEAKKIVKKMTKEKEEYENKIKTLEQEAFVQMIKQEQEREERKRAKMLQEKQEKIRQEKRRKKFLEVAFDGNVEELKFIIDEVNRELNTRSELDSSQKKSIILKLIDTKDSNNNTALSEASASGNTDVIKFLLSKGANPNSLGSFNRSSLWRAAFASHLETSQVLLENGADPRLYSSDGQRPTDVATNKSVRDLLENWNLDLTDRMLDQMRKANEANVKEQIKSLDSVCRDAEKEFENAKKDFEIIKTSLFKCNQELDRLHSEFLLNEKMYKELIDVKEVEKEDLKSKYEDAREKMVKKRIKYRETLHDAKKEKKELQKDLTKSDNADDGDHLASDEDDDNETVTKINIKEIDDMILRDLSGLISKSNKWPLIIDQNDQACTFLRYRDVNYINCFDTKNMQPDKFRLALLGAIRYGKPFVLDLMEYDEELLEAIKVVCDMIDKSLFNSLLDRTLLEKENFMKIVKPEDGREYDVQNFTQIRIKYFRVLFLTSATYPCDELLSKSLPIRIIVNTSNMAVYD